MGGVSREAPPIAVSSWPEPAHHGVRATMLKRRPSYCSDDGLLLRAEVRAVARLGHVAGLGTVGNDDDGDRGVLQDPHRVAAE